MTIPDVALIGAAKSGTTYLSELLNLHPKICLGIEKEPGFFSREKIHENGWDAYKLNFSNAVPDQLTLDCSTSYSRYPQLPGTARRLYSRSPGVKIIYLMRNPVERAYSHYIHRHAKELFPNKPIKINFDDFIKQDPVCIDSGDYQIQIEQYLKYFRTDSMLLIFLHELKEDKIRVLNQICDFLDIEFNERIFSYKESSNVTSDFINSRVRVEITRRLKRIPGCRILTPLIPENVREIIYSILNESFIGIKIKNEFSPPTLCLSQKRLLINYYLPSIKWLESHMKKDLSIWYKE